MAQWSRAFIRAVAFTFIRLTDVDRPIGSEVAMLYGQIRPVICRAIVLDRHERVATGRLLYVFLILDRTDGSILERLADSRDLRTIVAFAAEHKRQHYGFPRISFDPPGEIDRGWGKQARTYEALELTEIFFASSSLGQS